ARSNARPICSICGRRARFYDVLHTRDYEYIPLWGFKVFFRYTPRRVQCYWDGVRVESLPWAEGKDHQTIALKVYLAKWARRLSWKEVAEIFHTSWDSVYRAVEYVVDFGLAHRNLDGITNIGIDELAVWRGHKYLTLVYQIDNHCKRLLWSGPDRKIKTLLTFFQDFGKDRCKKLKFICSDMWKPYLRVVRQMAPQALHVLDRFHIMKKFNEAIDQVRRQDVKSLKQSGQNNVLLSSRWILLKRKVNLNENQVSRLAEILKSNLNSVRAYLMREDFQSFWDYRSPTAALKFLKDWNSRTMRSRIKPMKRITKMLRAHQSLILNWFHADGQLSSGIVEGFNLKAKLTIRKAYGLRSTYNAQMALYHTLARLPDPPLRYHKFC
ncbi:MAG: ISL3 family transposase, partial [Bacteroidota bacterium]